VTDAAGYGWDACCALNLLATRQVEQILGSLGAPSYIVRQVLQGEVLTLRALPEEDPDQPLVAADFSAAIASGALQSVELSAEEQATFMAFATGMNDGEARTAALARHRGLHLVTDDRISLRIAEEHAIPILTTPDWVKWWADASSASSSSLRDCLYRIEVCARYKPRRMHPLYAWWISNST
jgi:hypothetical protein